MRERFKRPGGWSLRVHVAAASMTLVLCTSLATGLSLLGSARNGLDKRTEETLYRLSEQVGQRLENYVRARGTVAATLAAIPGMEEPERARAAVEALKANDSAVAWVGITDAHGIVVAGSGGVLNGRSIAQRPVFIKGSKGLNYGDVHDAVLLASLLPPDPQGRPTLFLDASAPIHDANGNLAGVVAVHLDWNKARDLVVPHGKYEHGTEALIIAADGKVMVGPDSIIGEGLAMMASVQESGPHLEVWPDGQEYLSGSTRNNLFGWRVVLRQQRASINAFLYGALSHTLGLALLVGAGMSMLAWFAAGYIARPLHNLAQAADRMRRGESGGTLGRDRSYSEISVLTESLGSMVSSLVRQKSELQVAIGEVDVARDEASRDQLTGLPNRRALMRAAAAITSGEGCMALACLDLDGFKAINDTHGHAAGDAVLVDVAARMSECLRPGDMLSRLGGDEFVLLLVNERQEGALRACARIIEAVSQPMQVAGIEVSVGCSAGIAVWCKGDEQEWEAVLDLADGALYEAKRAGRGRAVVAGKGPTVSPPGE